MTSGEVLVLKVLCGSCGTKIGEAWWHPESDGIRYRPAPTQTARGDAISAPTLWCLEHGYAVQADVQEAATRASARPERVTTLRARMRGSYVE